MELKAIHLIRRLERIDRDLEELNSLQQGIREDREYAPRIIDPLLEESTRLKKLKSRILSLIIKNPPENLVADVHLQKNSIPEVEITIQHEKKSKSSGEEKKPPQSNIDHAKSQDVRSQQKKSNPYRFIFEQNN